MVIRMTAYQAYRRLTWTSASDECEAGCGRIMNEESYVEGKLGHYCSQDCLEAEEGGVFEADDDLCIETNTRPRGDREDFHSDG